MKQIRERLFEFSTRLIGMPPDMVGLEIENSLKLIGQHWNFDCITLTEFTEYSREIRLAYSYTAPGIALASIKNLEESCSWVMEQLRRGEMVLLAQLPDELPREAGADLRYCQKEGIQSVLALPLKVGQSVLGACFFVSFHKAHVLKKAIINQLYHLVEILTNSLERIRATERIDELLRFEQLLSDISAKYISLPCERFDHVIKRDLERLGRLLGVDRCVFYALSGDSKQFRWDHAHMWWPREDDAAIREFEAWGTRDWDFWENFRYYFDQWSKNEIVQFSSLEQLPEEASRLRAAYGRFGVKSGLSVPMFVSGSILGALVITTHRRHRTWSVELAQRLRLFAEVFANILIRKQHEEKIQTALSEIKELKERLEADYLYLTEEISLEHGYGDIVGRSQAMQRILVQVAQVAPTNAPVLILGETGTGKGLIARSIHNASKHSNRPLIQVNCAALTPSLIESELFGHEKGAFTGATARRAGRFELAHGTTLFLDEIGELPLNLQPKLLRVLQDGEFERVGGATTIKTDMRIIAATNRDMERDVNEGKFRRDLWYRLSVFPIAVPPLRERLEDISLFVKWFLDKHSKWSGKRFKTVHQKTLKALADYSWPGNIRELENLIERAVITSPEGNLQIEIPAASGMLPEQIMTSEEAERSYLLKVLESTSWVIEGPRGAALMTGLNRSTLRSRLKKLGIERP